MKSSEDPQNHKPELITLIPAQEHRWKEKSWYFLKDKMILEV